jgi:hypothetical protein
MNAPGYRLALLCLCGAAAATTQPAAAQTNLLLNGDFQTLSPAAEFPPWLRTGPVQPVATVPLEANYGIGVRGDGENAASISQPVNSGPPATGAVRVRFTALVQRSGPLTMPVRCVVTPQGQLPVILTSAPEIVPADGGFHPVTATVVLPSRPASLNFSIETAQPGAGTSWKLDDAALALTPLPFQTNPGAGPPGAVLQLNGPALQPGMQVSIGGVPANVLLALPGQLTVQVPPPPPTAAPGALLAIAVAGGGGQTLTDPAGFRHLLPFSVSSVEPGAASAVGGTQVRVRGGPFPADLHLVRPAQPLLPPVFPDFIESPNAFLFTVPAQPAGEVPWQVNSVSRPPSPDAGFTLAMEPPPVVTLLTPDTGPPAGGTLMTIQGNGFQPGARVFFDLTEAQVATVLSPNAVQAIAPPHQMEHTVVSVVNPSGLASTEPVVFRYLEGVRGDVNGDNRVDLHDVILALESVTDAAPPGPLHLASDVNSDERIGLAEATTALRLAEQGEPGSLLLHPPELLLSAASVTAGEPVFATVGNGVPEFEPFTILWGDGEAQVLTSGQAAGFTPHSFRAGAFQVRLLCSYGLTPPVTLLVNPQPSITAAALTLLGTDEDGAPVNGGSGRLDPAAPALVQITVQAQHLSADAQSLSGVLRVRSSRLSNAVTLPWQGTFAAQPGGQGTLLTEVPLPLDQWVAPGEYYISLVVNTNMDGTGAVPPTGVAVSLSGYVTEEDCHELERQWQEKRLEKAAKVAECEELKQRLADCLQKQADLEAAKAAAQQAIMDLDGQIASKQSDYDTLFNSINQFLSGVGTLVSYPAGGGAPPGGGNFVGSRKSSASAGVGIQFGDAQDLIDRMDLYKKVHGHSIGKDLNRLRDCIAQIDGLKAQKAAKEAEITDLDAQLAAIAADIAAKQAALAACMAECEALEQELEDFAAAHQDKLEQLEDQREAEDAIGESERRSDAAEDDPDKVDELADEADDVIGGRSGTPGQTGADSAKVDDGRDCAEIARQKLAEARAKQAEARAALAAGNTDLAKQKAAEANALIAEAEQKLEEAKHCIREGRSSALGRKPRECVDGTFVLGTPAYRVVWDSISDISIAPMGVKPEKWASTLKNARGVLDGLKNFFELLGIIEEATDAIGVDIPVGGTVTPDPAETAEAIVNAWLEIFRMTQPYDVWAELTGHTEWSRVDRLCVNGCWTYIPVEGRLNDTVKRRCVIGTIWGGDRASREAQLKSIISKVGPNFHCR